MDDGSRASQGCKIATNCFEKEELKIIQQVLKEKYNLEIRIHSAGKENQYVLYIPKNNMRTFSKLIKKYLVRSMYYKIEAAKIK